MNQKGTPGNDLIEAGLTRLLSGKAGNDILIGSNADDILSGGLGSDILTSGASFDTFLFSSKSEGIDTSPIQIWSATGSDDKEKNTSRGVR